MRGIELSVRDAADPAVVERLERGLDEHSLPVTGERGFLPLTVLAHDADGALVGGAYARVNWSWIHLSLLWVDAVYRERGLGSRLLHAVEAAGSERGCRFAHLDTFSYQARPFYERHGYVVFGTLEDYPPGHERYFLRKRLDAAT